MRCGKDKWSEYPDGECDHRQHAKTGGHGGNMHVQSGAGHKSEVIAMDGAYFAAERRQALVQGCATHVCTQERRRPTNGCSKDGKLTRAEAMG